MSGNRPVFAGGNPGREGKHHRLYGWVCRSTCTLVCLAAAGALTLTAAAGPGESTKFLSAQTPAVTSHPDQQTAGGVTPGNPTRPAAPSAIRTAGTRAGSPIFLVVAADGTPSFDADDQAGNDRSADNGIVRVNDKVIYQVQYQYNNLQNQDVSYVLKLPKGLMMDDVPTSCAAGSTLTPKSAGQPSLPYRSDSLDDLEAQTLTCLMGRKTGSSTEARIVEVKVSNAVPNGRVLTPESLELKVGNVPGTSAGAHDYAADSLPPGHCLLPPQVGSCHAVAGHSGLHLGAQAAQVFLG